MTSASSSVSQGAPLPPGETARDEALTAVVAAHRQALAALPLRQLPAPPAQWLHHGQVPGDGQPLVLMHQTALLQIIAHSRSNTNVELGGALLGQVYRYKSGVVVEVKACLLYTSRCV